jgi:hypothetical protein
MTLLAADKSTSDLAASAIIPRLEKQVAEQPRGVLLFLMSLRRPDVPDEIRDSIAQRFLRDL